MSPENSSKIKDIKVVFEADDIYEDPQAGILSEFGRRLQQGGIMSSAILEHNHRVESGTLPDNFSQIIPETIYGYLREASEYLGIPDDASFWASRINAPVQRAFGALYGVSSGDDALITFKLPVDVAKKVKIASRVRNPY